MEDKHLDQQSPGGSVTVRLPQLQAGDHAAEAWFMERYFERVCSQARRFLGASTRSAHDEEDVALTVMRNFLLGSKDGSFQRLRDRDDLEQILSMLTRRKTIDYFRRAISRRKYEVGESVFGDVDSPFAELAKADPPRDLVMEMAEEIRDLFRGVRHKQLRLVDIAVWRLQGFSVSEIADRLELLPHTIYRRLRLIKDRWQHHMKTTDDD